MPGFIDPEDTITLRDLDDDFAAIDVENMISELSIQFQMQVLKVETLQNYFVHIRYADAFFVEDMNFSKQILNIILLKSCSEQ